LQSCSLKTSFKCLVKFHLQISCSLVTYSRRCHGHLTPKGPRVFEHFSWPIVTSIIPHLCGIVLMIATIEMKEDLCSFPMKKHQQSCTIFEKMSLLTRLMKGVWLGSTLYIHWNGNVEIRMLKSVPKFFIFFPHHGSIQSLDYPQTNKNYTYNVHCTHLKQLQYFLTWKA